MTSLSIPLADLSLEAPQYKNTAFYAQSWGRCFWVFGSAVLYMELILHTEVAESYKLGVDYRKIPEWLVVKGEAVRKIEKIW